MAWNWKKGVLLGLSFLALLLQGVDVRAVSVADYPVGAAANGIGGSKHNMGVFGRVLTSTGTTEICVFCHTPHHTNTALPPTPLWNRVNSATSYAAYGTTLGGTNVAQVGSVSLACLSCHDGVTTWDTLVNAPGKDGVAPAGADQVWNFRMPGPLYPLTLVSQVDHFSTATVVDPTYKEGSCWWCHTIAMDFKENPAVALTIGTDLRNDHPVSIAYNDTVASLRPKTTLISSIDLTTGLASSALTSFSGNLSQNRWAVKGFVSNTARIDDLLKNGKVECSSCHDPHFKNLSWDEAEGKASYNVWNDGTVVPYFWCSGENCTDGQFLRRVGGNTGSGVCRTCHNK